MMKLAEKSKAAALFEHYCDGYKRRDLPFLLNLFTKNCNLWGTGIDEYRVGLKELQEQIERDWRQSEHGEIHIVSWIPTSTESHWAAAVCKALITIDGQQHIFDHLRGTLIVAKENGEWKISHMHASFPDYRNPSGYSFPEAV